MLNMITTLFFDFSGVVASSAYYRWALDNLSDDVQLATIFTQLDRGDISLGELHELFSTKTGIPETQIQKEALQNVVIDRELLKLITDIKKKYAIVLLTNYNHEILELIFSEHSLHGIFDEVIISSEYGMAKPDKEFFEKALKIMHVTPEESFFTDDSQKNVEGASAIGINAHRYTSLDSLKIALGKLVSL